MINLQDLTLIIPVKIDSEDRLYNIKAVLGYLNNHFKTNVEIYEAFDTEPILNFLQDYNNLNIGYESLRLSNNEPFHRTKYLNKMIDKTKTSVIANYDADVLLPVDSYVKSVEKIKNGEADFIYPFTYGDGQKQLYYSKWYEHKNKDLIYWNMSKFLETFDIYYLDYFEDYVKIYKSHYGHCLFSSTQSYRNSYGENESFISYGPEDVERALRFEKLGYKIIWLDGCYVYHLEHERTKDSNVSNPYFEHNNNLFNYLNNLNSDDLKSYYDKNIHY